MIRTIGAVAIIATLAGCTLGGRPASASETSAAYYDYSLPETSVKVSMHATVVECRPSAVFKLEPQVTVAAVRGPTSYRLVGGDLTNWLTSHDLSLTSFDTGALKTVNSADSDRTFAAVTNVIKGVISLAAIAGSPNPTGADCSAPTADALNALKALKIRRGLVAQQLQTSQPPAAQGLTATLAAIDAEIGRLSASDALSFDLPAKDVDLGKAAGEVVWKNEEMPSSLISPNPALFTIAFCLRSQTTQDPEAGCTESELSSTASLLGPAPPTQCGADATCSRTIVMREPKRAVLTMIGKGQAFGKRINKPVKSVTLPIAQWGTPTLISTTVGLGKSRTVGFTLDEYGNRTSFTWKSDARAESISGGIAGALEPAATLAGKLRDAQLTEQKAELDRLNTAQQLKKARACQAILDAGGTCP